MKVRWVHHLMAAFWPEGALLRTKHGARMRVQPRSYIGWSILTRGDYEGETLARALELIREEPDAVFLDIGANEGLFTCVLGALPGVRGLAVEPWPKNYERLKTNLALNPSAQVQLYDVALSRQAGVLEMEHFLPHNPGTVRVVMKDQQTGSRRQTVRAMTLNELLQQAGSPRVTLLKIDIEGYEPMVLEGFDWEGPSRPRHVLM